MDSIAFLARMREATVTRFNKLLFRHDGGLYAAAGLIVAFIVLAAVERVK